MPFYLSRPFQSRFDEPRFGKPRQRPSSNSTFSESKTLETSSWEEEERVRLWTTDTAPNRAFQTQSQCFKKFDARKGCEEEPKGPNLNADGVKGVNASRLQNVALEDSALDTSLRNKTGQEKLLSKNFVQENFILENFLPKTSVQKDSWDLTSKSNSKTIPENAHKNGGLENFISKGYRTIDFILAHLFNMRYSIRDENLFFNRLFIKNNLKTLLTSLFLFSLSGLYASDKEIRSALSRVSAETANLIKYGSVKNVPDLLKIDQSGRDSLCDIVKLTADEVYRTRKTFKEFVKRVRQHKLDLTSQVVLHNIVRLSDEVRRPADMLQKLMKTMDQNEANCFLFDALMYCPRNVEYLLEAGARPKDKTLFQAIDRCSDLIPLLLSYGAIPSPDTVDYAREKLKERSDFAEIIACLEKVLKEAQDFPRKETSDSHRGAASNFHREEASDSHRKEASCFHRKTASGFHRGCKGSSSDRSIGFSPESCIGFSPESCVGFLPEKNVGFSQGRRVEFSSGRSVFS